MTNRAIEHRVTRLLASAQHSGQLPIDVRALAEFSGIAVEIMDLGKDVSGVLVQKDGYSIIGINANDGEVRQRFSIAHELGHFHLHGAHNSVFVDRAFSVKFRNSKSSLGTDKIESEANAFAAALLMPARLIREKARRHDFDVSDDNFLQQLSVEFNVSLQAIVYRLINLRLLPRHFVDS